MRLGLHSILFGKGLSRGHASSERAVERRPSGGKHSLMLALQALENKEPGCQDPTGDLNEGEGDEITQVNLVKHSGDRAHCGRIQRASAEEYLRRGSERPSDPY